MTDLFEDSNQSTDKAYSAKDIEVLEGLEPVRRRPGMYIGGTDDAALHHLVAEILDNSMDEAVAGHADWIELELQPDNTVLVRDNGRGIPTDPHPKFPDKSALEVILTTLHSGGKFSGKAYETSGGLHGVGMSVVNALTEKFRVEVCRDRKMVFQEYSKGTPLGPLQDGGAINNRRGTTVIFKPDPEIFGARAKLKAATIFRMARSKAYLYKGVEIRWSVDPSLLTSDDPTPQQEVLKFPNGILDYLEMTLEGRDLVTDRPFAGEAKFADSAGRVEWAVGWPESGEGYFHSYCNTVPTPLGGTHEAGFRYALTKAIKAYGDMLGQKKASAITAEDVFGGGCIMLSVFIPDPQFQGQTKEKLGTQGATKLVETAVRDHFDHWLTGDTENAKRLLERIILRAEERQRRKEKKETKRQSATRRLRLPGKLADCSRSIAAGTEIFLVEGDSAGGSAKQARDRETQAVLPLRGKILNVASATYEKMMANQEIKDMIEAFGCGSGSDFRHNDLRYERIIIMTDADVDGAHIASLLMTFFYQEMPGLIESGSLYLAMPPLYRLTQGGKSVYAMDDAEKEVLIESEFKNRNKVEISRFKGLGEMPPAQLRETTMAPKKRTLLRVTLPDAAEPDARGQTKDLVTRLMGKKPELRFQFIQEHARFVEDIDV
ncbi:MULTISPECIES: DNA topoisomerase IV subunit B [Thalassospira]|jgi:topoisomerase IV subunit B|uniref:DNA topoisomerase 4 subunit B n=1 Tax=Thalassospira profundimaris TaxID=502049 RepID=A0A367VCV3_9PROT|nr:MULTISPECIES: DNA topoisomerase IV subunit B [Thalassospira]MBR9901079.1 DNA topoisomerase IV subunit B [Rhodospirillales bacterium]KZB70256.1 DNA topoisomerase IV subunit B [Thalassospira sp. MCCC 1A01148]MBO6807636.1 DNA topoisomerase IV subunit B [Thalassospira sp.]MBO6840161.1 DNA topoisomerase IV subunit B [Thalassospira sp.]MBS8272396.1 DNA topoisomerase IV subunit B [Thalassospira tepidiphila]|tara:strand:+ start:4288 stop:6270 length:1983 start_codon:yes stop_codon:yes gene_type:complete